MFKKIQNFIISSDFLGNEASLYTEKNYSSYKSTFGGIISLLVMICIISGGSFFCLEFLNRKSFSLITNIVDDFAVNYEKFENVPFLIRLSGDYGKKFPKDYYFIDPEKTFFDQKVSSAHTTYPLGIKQCDISMFESRMELFKDIQDLESYFCFDFKDESFDLIGTYGKSPVFTYLLMFIRPCHLTPTPGVVCPDKEAVDKALSVAYVDLITIDHKVDHNSAIPYKETIYKARIPVSNTIYKRIWISYQLSDYKTDAGFLFESFNEVKFHTVSGYNIDLDIRSNYPFVLMTLINTEKKISYERSYMKAQTVLANVGGIIKGLTMIGFILNYPISNNLHNLEMINAVYNNVTLSAEYNIKDESVINKLDPEDRKKLSILSPSKNLYNPKTPQNQTLNENNKGANSIIYSIKKTKFDINYLPSSFNASHVANSNLYNLSKLKKNNLKPDNNEYFQENDSIAKNLINTKNPILSTLKPKEKYDSVSNKSSLCNSVNNPLENENKDSINNNSDSISNTKKVNNFIKNLNNDADNCKSKQKNTNLNNEQRHYDNITSDLEKNQISINSYDIKTKSKRNFNEQVDLSKIIFKRNKIKLKFGNLFDPFQWFLSSKKKHNYFKYLTKAQEALSIRNLISFGQEFHLLKRLIMNPYQTYIVENIFKNNAEDIQNSSQINLILNSILKNDNKNDIDNRITKVLDIGDFHS